MDVRKIEESDIAFMAGCFRDKAGVPGFSSLLASPYGFIAESSGKPVAGIYCYLLKDMQVGLIGFPGASQKFSKEERSVALNMVIKTAEAFLLGMGYRLGMTYSSVEAVGDRFAEQGYTRADVNVTQYIKFLGEPHG